MVDEFPGNSHRAVSSKSNEEPAKPEKVIEPIEGLGKVGRRKKSLGRRFSESFFQADVSTVVKYLVTEVFLPAMQNLVIDAVTHGFEKAVYGEARTPPSTRRGSGAMGSRTHISYDRPTIGTRQSSATGSMMSPRSQAPARMPASDVQDVFFESRLSAQRILESLDDVVELYHAVSVADLKTMIKETPTYTDNQWGWTDLSGTNIRPVRDGYVLILPPPEDLRQ